jgi:hypothetical protein
MIRPWVAVPAFAFLIAYLLPHEARSQESRELPPVTSYTQTEGWTGRKIAATGVVGAVFVSTWVDAYYTWWKETEKPFSFFSERWVGGAHRGIDKPGHFFGTYSIFRVTNDILLWGGYRPSAAFWWATGLALFNGFQIEVGDGFSQYGFDYQDLVFDFAGVGYAMLQSEIPFLEDFDFKFSYWSATGIRTPIAFTKDYDAMTIWLSLGMHNLLPDGVAQYWPAWLNLAVGYSVDDRESKREVAIGIDINFEGFSTHSEDVFVAERLGDLWHAPLPAVKFTEHKVPRYYGAYKQ